MNPNLTSLLKKNIIYCVLIYLVSTLALSTPTKENRLAQDLQKIADYEVLLSNNQIPEPFRMLVEQAELSSTEVSKQLKFISHRMFSTEEHTHSILTGSFALKYWANAYNVPHHREAHDLDLLVDLDFFASLHTYFPNTFIRDSMEVSMPGQINTIQMVTHYGAEHYLTMDLFNKDSSYGFSEEQLAEFILESLPSGEIRLIPVLPPKLLLEKKREQYLEEFGSGRYQPSTAQELRKSNIEMDIETLERIIRRIENY